MASVPEFILRKLYVPDSLKAHPGGFSFALNNSFAPATVIGFGLDVDSASADSLRILAAGGEERLAAEITPDADGFASTSFSECDCFEKRQGD